MTPVVANLSNQVWDVLVKPIEKRLLATKKIMVIDDGTMRLDVAQVPVHNGYGVVVRDIKDEIIQASEARLNRGLDKLVGRGRLDEAKKAEILPHMSFITELAATADTGPMVETAIKNLDIKKSIFVELDSLCKPGTILASNTSPVSITTVAATTKRLNRFIGMRLFNPAIAMELMGAVRGAHISDKTYRTIAGLVAVIGKEPVEVSEALGSVVDKILVPMVNEGIDLAYAGVASVEGVNTVTELGANRSIGPLALSGLIGPDVYLAIMDTLYDNRLSHASPSPRDS